MGLLFALMISAVTAFAADCATLRGQVVRLHILANSDQAFDQQIKLEVRDALLERFGSRLGGSMDKDDARQKARTLLPQIESCAKEVIQKNGYSYEVSAQVVKMYFETRTYGPVTLPAGEYEAVRVTIGQAKGHNWWCVLYPPICIPAAAESPKVKELQNDSVAAKNPQFEPRFKIVELLEELALAWE